MTQTRATMTQLSAAAFLFLMLAICPACRAADAPATGKSDAASPTIHATQPTTQPHYTYLKRPAPDGIGKVYMGREIAHVMGHTGADWLDRPEREKEEAPRKAVEMMQLKPTDVVAGGIL